MLTHSPQAQLAIDTFLTDQANADLKAIRRAIHRRDHRPDGFYLPPGWIRHLTPTGQHLAVYKPASLLLAPPAA